MAKLQEMLDKRRAQYNSSLEFALKFQKSSSELEQLLSDTCGTIDALPTVANDVNVIKKQMEELKVGADLLRTLPLFLFDIPTAVKYAGMFVHVCVEVSNQKPNSETFRRTRWFTGAISFVIPLNARVLHRTINPKFIEQKIKLSSACLVWKVTNDWWCRRTYAPKARRCWWERETFAAKVVTC